jgi:hypothetical protein
VARHVVTNLTVEPLNGSTVRVTSLLLLFAGNGTPPLPNLVPQVVGDVVDTLVRDGDAWLVQQRTITHIFIAPDTVLGVPTK